jgi:hypothetical protein
LFPLSFLASRPLSCNPNVVMQMDRDNYLAFPVISFSCM